MATLDSSLVLAWDTFTFPIHCQLLRNVLAYFVTKKSIKSAGKVLKVVKREYSPSGSLAEFGIITLQEIKTKLHS